MTETQYRFLKAIAERVPDDLIVEVRLFPTIRQGGVESGVAVVATEVVAEPPAAPAADAEAAGPAESPADVNGNGHALAAGTLDEGGDADGRAAPTTESGRDVVPSAGPAADPAVDHETEAEQHPVSGADAGEGDDAAGEETSTAPVAVAAPAIQRYAVHSARYRLVLKGPDRGKWEFDIVHQADAPLETVERVVRGVARRAGEDGEAEAFTAAELRTALSQPWWSTEP